MPVLTPDQLASQLFADVPEVAALLRIDQRTVRRSIEAGDIPAIRTGQRWRVPTSWLRQQAGIATPETAGERP